jgi:hypothetical protein
MPNPLPPLVEAELSTIAERMAALLETVPPREALSALLAFSEKISRRLEQSRAETASVRKEDPSDAGAPPGAPKPIAVPPEVFAEALRTFDEGEIIEGMNEIRAGRGVKLEQFLSELEKLVPSDSSPR